MTLTYYECSKRYSPLKVFYPKHDRYCSIERMFDNISLNISSTDAGIRNLNDISSPTIYICRNKGILRLNRHSFVNVTIPDELKHAVDSCSDIEVCIETEDYSSHSVYARVKKVLRFPEMLDIETDGDDDDSRDDDAFDGDNDGWEDDEIRGNGGSVFPNATGNLHVLASNRDHAHDVFREWLVKNSGTLLYEYSDHDCEFVMAHCMERCFLVSFFDGKSEDRWHGDEWGGPGFRRPYWIGSSRVALSPLFGVAVVLAYLRASAPLDVFPMVILGDDIQFVNINEMLEKWDALEVFACKATAEDENIGSFDSLIKYAITNNYAPIVERGDVEKAVDALQAFHVEDWE